MKKPYITPSSAVIACQHPMALLAGSATNAADIILDNTTTKDNTDAYAPMLDLQEM